MVRQHVLVGAYVEEGAHLMMSGTQEKEEGLEKKEKDLLGMAPMTQSLCTRLCFYRVL